MKTHTTGFKENISLFGKEIDSKITYELNGEIIELGAEDLNSITPHYQGNILKSVMKQLDIDSNTDIPLKTILTYQFGVKVGDLYEYINFGSYVVYSSEKQKDTNSYKIICYDKMLYSMVDYESMNITYPITIKDYIIAICNKLGLTFKNVNDTFANYDKMINSELYLDEDGNTLGYTYRDVLDELAQVTASTICINEDDDELEIRYINNTNDTIDEEYLKDVNVNFGEKFGPVNTIVLSRSADTDNIYYPSVLPQNPCEIKISDNQIMNGNDRDEFMPDIYNKLNGLEYYVNDFSSFGICYYNLCDKYNVSIGEEIYSCIMFNDEVNITQGLSEYIYTDIPEETQTDYTKADKTDRKINQTILSVDKQNQKIEAKVSKDDIVADLNIAIEEGQGVLYFQGNYFVVDADNLKIDKYGNVIAYNLEIKGGNIVLEDDGTQTNASIKISVPTQYTDSLLVGDDLSGKKLKFNLKDYTYSTIQALTDDIIICEYEDEDNNTTTEYALYLTAYTEEETQDKYVLVSIREGSTHVGNVIKQIKLVDDKIPTNFEIELYENFGKITYLTSDLIINDIKQITYEVIRKTSLSGNGLIADIKADYDYTQSDLDRCQQIVLGSITPTEADYRRLDVDKNGVINSFDLLKISKYIQANIGITNPGKIIIDTQSIDDNIVLLDGDGNKKVSIGLYDGVYINGNKVLSENKLYEDSTGSLGTITLDDDVSNYEYIEIFYKTNNNYFDSKKITSEAYGSGKTITLSLYAYTNTGISYQNFREIVVDGTSITTKGSNYGQLTVRSSSNTLTNTNNIYIYKVVGYK